MPDYQFEKTDHVSYLRDIPRGVVFGGSTFSSFGKIATGGAVTDHIVWANAGSPALQVPAEAGVQMGVASSSVDDDLTGTGIQQIEIHYLDGALNEQTETVDLDGTTTVTTAATDIRFINEIYAKSLGSGGKAAGNISVTNGGTTYGYIAAGARRSTNVSKRVPTGKRLMISALYAGASSGTADAAVTINLVTTAINGIDSTEDAITYPQAGIALQDSSQVIQLDSPFPVGAGQIVSFEATSDKAATVTAGLFGWLESV